MYKYTIKYFGIVGANKCSKQVVRPEAKTQWNGGEQIQVKKPYWGT